jgi:hypothetical protein
MTEFDFFQSFQLTSNDQTSKIQNTIFLKSKNLQTFNDGRKIPMEQIFFVAQLPDPSGF